MYLVMLVEQSRLAGVKKDVTILHVRKQFVRQFMREKVFMLDAFLIRVGSSFLEHTRGIAEISQHDGNLMKE